jgi:predicted CoA-binding protein
MSATKKTTLVIGASENPERYSNMAILKLLQAGEPVAAIGNKKGRVNDVEILTGQPPFNNIDTITLYLNPVAQKQYYDYIFSLKPRRIIFNPGTENSELEALAKQHQVTPQVACTLVLLATRQY